MEAPRTAFTDTVSSFLEDFLPSTTSAKPSLPPSQVIDHFVPKTDGGNADRDISAWLDNFGVRPLATLGVVGNFISLWVWSAERSYNATTFLFKYLAILDSAFLAFAFVKTFLNDAEGALSDIAQHGIYLSQLLSVHTTLLVAVTRWMAVTYPLHVQSLLAPRRVYGTCLVFFFWCLGLQTVEFVRLKYGEEVGMSRTVDSVVFVTKRVVGLVLPLDLLLILSVSLVVKTRRQMKKFGFMKSDSSQQANQRQQQQQPQPTGDRGTRRLTMAVVCISLCCFLAYPCGIIMKIVANFQPPTDSKCDPACYTAVVFTAYILQIINSDINVVFYWAFASRFRELFKVRMAWFSKTRRLLVKRWETTVEYDRHE